MAKKDRHPFVTRRKELGYTQEQIARVVGLTARAIQMWEAGVTQPSLSFSQVADLCDFLKCTPRELATDFEQIQTTAKD
ncbi:MAG: helix-turn-helix transcriptional regulator [Cyanobacteria bacterium P01_F01_bin.53]